MAYFAQINENNIVTNVIVAEQDYIDSLPDKASYIQTSYNTRANTHLNGGTALRGNYASTGYTYDSENDVFYAPSPFPSWILNTTTWIWEAPVPYPGDPTDGTKPEYIWFELKKQWITIEKFDELYG
jgi:hypothetical protein